MLNSQSENQSWTAVLRYKLADYAQLVKLRLALTVVFSAGIGFVLASQGAIAWAGLFWIALGGLLVTGSANALNEIIEKDYDKLMSRTENRPIPAGRMSVPEALLVAGIFGVVGIGILAYQFNMQSALIGAVSLFTYAFIYTPLKRLSNIAVFVGAIPGALPPVIGWVAVTGQIGYEAFILFAIQFIWQFPHFWAIAWVAWDDYQKAGYSLLPSGSGRSKTSAFYNILYITFLIPISLLPFMFGFTGIISAIVILITGSLFLVQAIQLYRKCTRKAALSLMFGSIMYLPVVMLALALDKV